MPHALRVFKMLKASGMPEERSLCIANVIEAARSGPMTFEKDKIVDQFCENGLSEDRAEVIADALQNCFPSQRFATHFNRGQLKMRLVRSGETALFAEQFLTALEPSVLTPLTAELRLPVKYPPGPGRVVMCDFTHLKKPEMQKERRAIVVSTKAASGIGRCTVVPVSAKPSETPNPLHHEFAGGSYPFFHRTDPVWAVCDHVYTVSLARLWAVNIGLRPQANIRISEADLVSVLKLLGTGLGQNR